MRRKKKRMSREKQRSKWFFMEKESDVKSVFILSSLCLNFYTNRHVLILII
jgi:hypothetical protein